MAKRAKQQTEPKKVAAAVEREMRPRVVRMDEASGAEPMPIDDSGISLEDLGQAYAALLQKGEVPYEQLPTEALPTITATLKDSLEAELAEPAEVSPTANENCDISPRSILEAMLFVGHPHNEPLSAQQVASLMRGVTAAEIEDLVGELNAQYAVDSCPYTIVSEGTGFRLTLHEDFSDMRERFYGRVKEARLTQAAIDTLAVVAYHQPVSPKKIDEFRGKPSGGLLNQLVRRQLIQLERSPENRKEISYRTTARFLALFGLESLEDLPRSVEFS